MPDRQEEVARRPTLAVVSESPQLTARIRSRRRDLRRWTPGDVGDDLPSGAFTGDLALPETWGWTRDADVVTAVIDLASPDQARAALAALRTVRPDAAVLLLSSELSDLDHTGDGTLARSGDIRDVLRLDIDDELQRLESERRVWCLRQFAGDTGTIPILVHPDPDPDAVSSALAVRMLLGGDSERTPIVCVEPMTRRENRRMAELLNIRVTRVTEEELRRFDRVITVDTQPRGLQQDGVPRLAVIDHHPLEPDSYSAEFRDIRPNYGATATMMTEYLRALDEKRIGSKLATALLFGIRTDTDSLMRGVTPADVTAYAFLQEHADLNLVRRFERPSYAPELARRFGRALAEMDCKDGLCAAWLGELGDDEAHMLPDFADFCLGIENVTWVAAGAMLDSQYVVTLRHAGATPGAGDVARAIARQAAGGGGGGHATMARVTMPVDEAESLLGVAGGERHMTDALGELVRGVLDDLQGASRRASRQAHPASGPAAVSP